MALISSFVLEARISMRQASSVPAPCDKHRWVKTAQVSGSQTHKTQTPSLNVQDQENAPQGCCRAVQDWENDNKLAILREEFRRTLIAFLSSWASYTGASMSRPRTTLLKFPLSSEDRSSARSCGKEGNRQRFSHCRHVDKHKQAPSAFGFSQSGCYRSSRHQPFRSSSAGVFQGGCGFWKKKPFPHKLTRVRTRGRRHESFLLPVRFPRTGLFCSSPRGILQITASMLHHAGLHCSVHVLIYMIIQKL